MWIEIEGEYFACADNKKEFYEKYGAIYKINNGKIHVRMEDRFSCIGAYFVLDLSDIYWERIFDDNGQEDSYTKKSLNELLQHSIKYQESIEYVMLKNAQHILQIDLILRGEM